MMLPAGSVIGILGGGQLGRMLACAAAKLGFDVHVYCPETAPPAARVAARHVCAGYEDAVALRNFAKACDIVTVEFENVPAAAAEAVAASGTPFRPGAKALAVAQDRAEEKAFLESVGIAVADWRRVDTREDLLNGLQAFGGAGLLKTRREGYDGKGQAVIASRADADSAWEDLGARACVLETLVEFDLEISGLVARGLSGECVAWTPPHNMHSEGMLRRSRVPAPVDPQVLGQAQDISVQLAEAMDYVGVLALEFFVMADGQLLANEFAPRVHNSGHWTPEACATGQFENHIRAVAGWPLGRAERFHDVEMINIVGQEALRPPAGFGTDVSLTLYGKGEARAGRKMGHSVRRTGPARSRTA
ncbi:MAG: 5-(carboxyamino)imidazole ribonucleotide synthase [Alphaproteobacteria bacterium]|jgi:5-(carboxyamino)imidazole ribonucleotide synthase|nr:5-(carboxyamino)imidazole ribonucleotide synthase [Alphaproteobacteria bacterium]